METDLTPVWREMAARLRAERARLNLTLAEAAGRVGVHIMTISRYENATHPPTLENLYRLALAYGVPVAALLPDPPPVKGRKK